MTEKEFLDFINALCKHPKMYTATSTFNEVTAYLEGFGSCADVGKNSYHSAFTLFHLWMVKKIERSEVIINWNDFREMFTSDSEALYNLPILYEEYVDRL